MFRGKQYGFMSFNKIDEDLPPTYQVLHTNDRLLDLCKELEQYILKQLEIDEKRSVMFYQVKDHNPRLVSYQIIKTLQYPHIEIQVERTKDGVCKYQGDRELSHNLKAYMPTLDWFQSWYGQLCRQDTDSVKAMWVEQFQMKPRYRIQKRKKMIKSLLSHRLGIAV